jgi:hypothetical protein
VPRWKAPDWKTERNAAILTEVRQGAAPEVVAWRYRVPLRAVLGICEGAEMRERFAREHAESGGRVHMRSLPKLKHRPKPGDPLPGAVNKRGRFLRILPQRVPVRHG